MPNIKGKVLQVAVSPVYDAMEPEDQAELHNAIDTAIEDLGIEEQIGNQLAVQDGFEALQLKYPNLSVSFVLDSSIGD